MNDSMVDADLARAVAAVDWTAYTMAPATEYYRPEDVPPAFAELLQIGTDPDAWSAYNAVLESVVHHHSGWLYAAAAPAAALLVRVALETTGLKRRTASDVLADLVSWSVPGQAFTDPHGNTVRTREFIRNAVLEAGPFLLDLADRPVIRPTTESAISLLEALDATA